MNAPFSIFDNLDPDSNSTEESESHQEKHLSPKISTDEGRMISIKPATLNAYRSIRDNLDLDSNVTEESDRHEAKHFSSKNTTELGMRIHLRSVL
jgi:putative lipase involved disintegration of autophagic bodies